MISSTKEVKIWQMNVMSPSVQKRTNGAGFEAGPDMLTYHYGISLTRIMSTDERPYVCRNVIFDDGKFRSFMLARVGNFYEIGFGKPGDPIPIVTISDVECPSPPASIMNRFMSE